MFEPFATRIVLAARPSGQPKQADFRIEKNSVPQPGAHELLLRTRYLSLDPYMRGRMDDKKSYAPSLQIGDVMIGESVAEVVLSNVPDFAVGDLVLAYTGWQTHYVSNGTGLRKIGPLAAAVTARLGVLGMPGFTAYCGLRVIGQPKAGETVAVAAATGPVGSLVGQLAKLSGAKSVGIAGGPAKCEFAREVLGFDEVVDHTSPAFAQNLAAACPAGIDVYVENVGGPVWRAVLPLLNKFARVPISGLISQYNGVPIEEQKYTAASLMREVLSKSMTVRGFINSDLFEHYPAFLAEVGEGLRNGTIKHREDIVEGIENAPEAFIGMLEGRNFGKVIIKVS